MGSEACLVGRDGPHWGHPLAIGSMRGVRSAPRQIMCPDRALGNGDFPVGSAAKLELLAAVSNGSYGGEPFEAFEQKCSAQRCLFRLSRERGILFLQ